jgi:large subunit ribosomal protein L23Ae
MPADKGTKPAPKAAKATKVAGALKKGSGRSATRVHTKVHFYKPKTLKLARKPRVLARVSKSLEGNKSYDVIKFPLTTESAMKKIEDHNTLVFIVSITSNKTQIKAAAENLYGIKVAKVNTLIRPDGQKKAYVKLTSDFEAADVANRLAII